MEYKEIGSWNKIKTDNGYRVKDLRKLDLCELKECNDYGYISNLHHKQELLRREYDSD